MDKKEFTVEELMYLGFEKVNDGFEYLQLILNPTDFANSPYLATEDTYGISEGMKLKVSAGGDEGNWLGETELLAIIKRGYL